MTHPRITAEHEAPEIRTAQGQLSPGVLVTVTYEHGREHQALTALDRAVADVADQIRSTSEETWTAPPQVPPCGYCGRCHPGVDLHG